jgi:phosphoglycerate-specific signal transduction histidine kinase
MEDDIQKTALRLPRDLHRKVHEAAASSGRSMNAEIVARLQESFSVTEQDAPSSRRLQTITAATFDELMAKMQQRFQEQLDVLKQESAELEQLRAKYSRPDDSLPSES